MRRSTTGLPAATGLGRMAPQRLLRTLPALGSLLLICTVAGSSLPLQAADAEPIPVTVLRAHYLNSDTLQRRFPALIEARRSSALGFDSGGRIAEILADTGDRVEAGATLARLDTRAVEAQQAAAAAQAKAAEARARIAEASLKREAQLVDQGHVSPQRLEELAAEANAAEAVAAAARAEAAALEVRIDLARIEAPFAGVISERTADEGAIVGAGTPVLRIVEAGSLELRVGLPWRDAQRLQPERDYAAQVGGRLISVRLRATTDVIDARRRTVTAVFDLPADSPVRSGETAELSLPTEVNARGFWAPITALTEGRRGLWAVYTLVRQADGNTVLETRPVTVEYLDAQRAYLSGAVAEGEQLVATGVHRVVPGQRVRAVAEAAQ